MLKTPPRAQPALPQAVTGFPLERPDSPSSRTQPRPQASRPSHQGPVHSPGPLEETEGRHVVRGFEQHRFGLAFVKDAEAVQLHGAAPSGRRLDPRPAHGSAAAVLQNSRGRLLTGPRRLLPPSLGSTSGSGPGLRLTLNGGRKTAYARACVLLRGGTRPRRARSVPGGSVSACVAVLWCILFPAVAWTLPGGPRQCCAAPCRRFYLLSRLEQQPIPVPTLYFSVHLTCKHQANQPSSLCIPKTED